ncbi:MAG: hypothetical protein KDD67_15095 [Ignavibacteriae bacterium]|nr:hypothetical protein [Ignavibacteriota bacterium]MCB9217575.1 hypothetical protein [Ignavibacteria bacterium]
MPIRGNPLIYKGQGKDWGHLDASEMPIDVSSVNISAFPTRAYFWPESNEYALTVTEVDTDNRLDIQNLRSSIPLDLHVIIPSESFKCKACVDILATQKIFDSLGWGIRLRNVNFEYNPGLCNTLCDSSDSRLKEISRPNSNTLNVFYCSNVKVNIREKGEKQSSAYGNAGQGFVMLGFASSPHLMAHELLHTMGMKDITDENLSHYFLSQFSLSRTTITGGQIACSHYYRYSIVANGSCECDFPGSIDPCLPSAVSMPERSLTTGRAEFLSSTDQLLTLDCSYTPIDTTFASWVDEEQADRLIGILSEASEREMIEEQDFIESWVSFIRDAYNDLWDNLFPRTNGENCRLYIQESLYRVLCRGLIILVESNREFFTSE